MLEELREIWRVKQLSYSLNGTRALKITLTGHICGTARDCGNGSHNDCGVSIGD
jgi:hypothetical protein